MGKRSKKIAFSEKDKSGKPGKVVRVSPELWKLICTERTEGESVDSVLRRVIGIDATIEEFFVVPSDLCKSPAEARGHAVIKAVRTRNKDLAKETPLKVRLIG